MVIKLSRLPTGPENVTAPPGQVRCLPRPSPPPVPGRPTAPHRNPALLLHERLCGAPPLNTPRLSISQENTNHCTGKGFPIHNNYCFVRRDDVVSRPLPAGSCSSVGARKVVPFPPLTWHAHTPTVGYLARKVTKEIFAGMRE